MAESWRLCGELKATFQGNPCYPYIMIKFPQKCGSYFICMRCEMDCIKNEP